MSFDWGGFTGGIIGTMGAFGAAWYTHWKQKRNEQPLRDRRSLELIDVIRSTCDKYWWELHGHLFENISDLFLKTNEINKSLSTFLSTAIELNSPLVSLILRTIEELNGVGDKYAKLERTDTELFNSGTDMLEVLAQKINECDKLKNELLDQYKTLR